MPKGRWESVASRESRRCVATFGRPSSRLFAEARNGWNIGAVRDQHFGSTFETGQRLLKQILARGPAVVEVAPKPTPVCSSTNRGAAVLANLRRAKV